MSDEARGRAALWRLEHEPIIRRAAELRTNEQRQREREERQAQLEEYRRIAAEEAAELDRAEALLRAALDTGAPVTLTPSQARVLLDALESW